MKTPLQFTFIGTGTSQGVPVIACDCEVCQSVDPKDKRLRSAGLLRAASTCLVIDTGPDFRQQMLREKVKSLDAILFTHQHKDHVAGLDDVRAFNYAQKQDMQIYANEQTIDRLKIEFAYAFDTPDYPGVPKLRVHEISTKPFMAAGMLFQPIPVMHADLPVLGFRIGTFAYITDANVIPPSSMELLRGVEIMVLNALRRNPHHSHFTLFEAVDVVKEINPRQAYFTHISHLLGKHEEVSRELPAGISLAYDGLRIDL
ncbi:MAG: MBL fold metallo-hydrolase [Bacteroidia bacterium]|nr:MBL fold metallo-hydrolase [Bacteroidia bacterium]